MLAQFRKCILGFDTNCGGYALRGLSRWNLDLSVGKGVSFTERVGADLSFQFTNVMNHMALGVVDIHATEKRLIADGWKQTEQPKIGRDGKWQLNLYDPDDTRLELMEFTPVEKPCCSQYTGPHPKP